MWYWTGGFWWPGFVLMAVFMVICMVLMFRMMGSMGDMGMCGFGRWLKPRDEEDADERAHGDRARTDVDSPEGGGDPGGGPVLHPDDGRDDVDDDGRHVRPPRSFDGLARYDSRRPRHGRTLVIEGWARAQSAFALAAPAAGVGVAVSLARW